MDTHVTQESQSSILLNAFKRLYVHHIMFLLNVSLHVRHEYYIKPPITYHLRSIHTLYQVPLQVGHIINTLYLHISMPVMDMWIMELVGETSHKMSRLRSPLRNRLCMSSDDTTSHSAMLWSVFVYCLVKSAHWFGSIQGRCKSY